MKLQVTGLHMEVGDSIKDHCETGMQGLKSYFPKTMDVEIQLRKEQHKHKADVSVQSSGIRLRAVGDGADYYAAFDSAAEKLKRQVEKYKGRMQKHRRRREAQPDFATMPLMETTFHTLEESALDSAPEQTSTYAPDVTHKDTKALDVLTVDEAVMQMDLMHNNFCIFQNATTGQMNVVCREETGAVSWVEPSKTEATAATSAA